MADVDDDKIEEIFNAELERLQAAMDELDEAPQEEPETIADAFEMATSEPEMGVPESSPMDTLLLSTPVPQSPHGPPSAPQMDAQPPGPPSSPSNKPAFAPPPGVFGGPPGAPPGPPPSLAAVPPGPPSAPPMDAQPPGPPASPPGPPSAPPMDAQPPGPPSAPPMDAQPPGPPAVDSLSTDLLSPSTPSAPPLDSQILTSEPSMDVFGEVAPALPPAPPEAPPSPPPVPLEPVYEEPVFDKVDTETWDSNWDEGWGESADVYAKTDPTHIPEAVQDDVEWSVNSNDPSPQSDEAAKDLPTEAAMKRMKKAKLVDLANLNGVDSSGTKSEIIARLLG